MPHLNEKLKAEMKTPMTESEQTTATNTPQSGTPASSARASPAPKDDNAKVEKTEDDKVEKKDENKGEAKETTEKTQKEKELQYLFIKDVFLERAKADGINVEQLKQYFDINCFCSE